MKKSFLIKVLMLLLVVVVIWGLVSFSFAESINLLPDTGQDKCYDDSGEIPCPKPGEDFYGQDAQYQGLQQSFEKKEINGDLVVVDKNTDLMWQQADDGKTRNWEDAKNYCESLTYAGYSDWRMPTNFEINTIVDYGKYNPAIDESYFSCKSEYYWIDNAAPDKAWNEDFMYGADRYEPKSDNYYIRCVRGEPLIVDVFESATISGDKVVKDTTTGLMWQQSDDGKTRSWKEALSYCENLSYAGYNDWRLPNVQELRSIVKYRNYNPSIDTKYFSTKSENYWSATTYAEDTAHAWSVSFDYGHDTNWSKSNTYYVRCCRSGLIGNSGDLCDSDHLTNCTSESDCENAGGYWYDNKCNKEEEEDDDDSLNLPVNVPTKTIKVDGQSDDWSGIEPVAVDETGDSLCGVGSDIYKVYLAKDDNYLYWRIDSFDGKYNWYGQDSGWTIVFYQQEGSYIKGDIHTRIWDINGTEEAIDEHNGNNWESKYHSSEYGAIGDCVEGKIPISFFNNKTFIGILLNYYSREVDDAHYNMCDRVDDITRESSLEDNNSNHNDSSNTCSKNSLEFCHTESDCINAGGYWYDEECNSSSKPNNECDSSHLNLCTSSSDCEIAGGYWYNSKCNPTPQEPSESVTTTSNAHPDEALDAILFQFGVSQPNPENNKVNVAASSSVYLQPSLKVDSSDVGKSATLVMYIYLSSINYGFMLPTKTVTLESEQKFLNLPKALDFSKAVGMSFDVYYGYRIEKTLKYNTYRVTVVEGNLVPDCSKYTDASSCTSNSNCKAEIDFYGNFKSCILNCEQYTSESDCENAFDGDSCKWNTTFGTCGTK